MGRNPYDAHLTLPVPYVLDNWRPGSFDRTWEEEFADLGSPQRIGEMLLRYHDEHGHFRDGLPLQMLRGGHCQPITLGWDGRLWAGHHRLWLYHTVGWPHIPVDVVPPGQRRGWPANHCAPAEGRAE